MGSASTFEKSLEDELDLKNIDQLAGTVAQISSFCFETKKFCITTVFVVMTLLVKFTQNKLDCSIFIAGIAIPLCFWFLDSVGYFYQVRLRGKMSTLQNQLMQRNSGRVIQQSVNAPIDPSRLSESTFVLVRNAAINHSMWTYALVAGLDVFTWILYGAGIIR